MSPQRASSTGDSRSHHFHHGQKALVLVLGLTLSFMFVEFWVGWLANSLALMTDAAHMLTDAGALLLGIFAFWISQRPSSPKRSFGMQRAEVLGALSSGLLIWLLIGVLIYEALGRLANPPPVSGGMVLVAATAGFFVNLYAMRILHPQKKGSLNVRAAYLHVLGDLLASIGVMVSGVLVLTLGWTLADPIATLIISSFLLYSSWKLITEAVSVLMEFAPKGMDPVKIKASLAALPGVEEVHDLHIWTVSSGRAALSVHLVAREAEDALGRAHELLERSHGIHHTTIQIEHPEKFACERCYDCLP